MCLGLSSDTKPTTVVTAGSSFVETDTGAVATWTGSDWTAATGGSAVAALSTTTGIDGKAVANINLYTIPTGRSCVVVGFTARLTTAVDATVVATVGIGINVAADDIISPFPLTGLTVAGNGFNFQRAGGVTLVGSAGGVIKFGIDVGYTATTATLAVDLLGYLI